MKKFYDTVNHTKAEFLFEELITKVNKDIPELNIDVPKFIFKSYLKCFAFNINIPKSDDSEYWTSYKIKNGEFSWIESSIAEHYTDISNERIGVPQGGALSGLIANIYFGNAQANGSDTRLIERMGADVRMIYKKVKLTSSIKFNDWGPYDYHRDFNLTYPVQSSIDLSTSVGKPSWFILPDTRIGIMGIWRSLDQYSPRYSPNTHDSNSSIR